MSWTVREKNISKSITAFRLDYWLNNNPPFFSESAENNNFPVVELHQNVKTHPAVDLQQDVEPYPDAEVSVAVHDAEAKEIERPAAELLDIPSSSGLKNRPRKNARPRKQVQLNPIPERISYSELK